MHTTVARAIRPWPALWALVIGFFMNLLDTTIVSIANPAIMRELNTDMTAVIWATSAYLLAYAVPLLITGRLGDRFGPKRLYMAGLVVFTVASLLCGLSTDIGSLIAARTVQGLGAAMINPQTMAVIMRIFPPERRGAAMGLWGAVAGVATLVGPVLGGFLVDAAGWEWVFFVNVPVGIVGLFVAWRYVPDLETRKHRFDLIGVALSAAGMFLLIFGIQEGQTYDWGTIVGPISVWSLIVAGVVILAVFVVWQRVNRHEPLMPLALFKDRNFALASPITTLVGLAFAAQPLPLVFYLQVARGLDVTTAALLLVPMAVVSGVLSPFVGRFSDRVNGKWVACGGFSVSALGLLYYAFVMTPDTPLWLLLIPSAVLGLGVSAVFAPLSAIATRNLPPAQAGAGSGVYNQARQVGSVFGSAVIAAMLNSRLAANLPGVDTTAITDAAHRTGGALPPGLIDGYSTAMAQSLWIPIAAHLLGAVMVLFFARPTTTVVWSETAVRPAAR